jgi:hypothetical protein
MTDSHPHASVRASALALLADGNSLEAVAHVFGIGVDVLQAWQQDRPDERPVEAPVPLEAPAAERPIEFDAVLAYQLPFSQRAGTVVILVFTGALLLALWHGENVESGPSPDTLLMVFVFASFVTSALWFPRARFTFGRQGVSDRATFSTSPELRYADIEKTTIEKGMLFLDLNRGGSKVPGWWVRFKSKAFLLDPPSLFIWEQYPLDPAIVERLRRLPGVSGRDVAPLMSLPLKQPRLLPKWCSLLLIVTLFALSACVLALPDLPFRQAWSGQPKLQQMTHVVGQLRGFSACHRKPFFNGRGVEATLRLEDGTIAAPWIPCLLARDVLKDARPHELAVDTWQPSDHWPVVYQVRLDDRLLLSYDTVHARQTAWLPLFFVGGLSLLSFWVLLLVTARQLLDDERWARD